MKIPTFVTAKDLRDELGAVAIVDLARGSDARRIAGEVNAGGDSYVRGKKEFEAAQKLLERLDGDDDEVKVRLVDEQGHLTEAGKIYQAWVDATSNRGDLFDGIGLGGKPSILRINIDGIDLGPLWQTGRSGDPRKCYAGPSTRLTVFETAPYLSHGKVPDEANGILLYAEGVDSVSVKRRGNMSVNDAKPQLQIDIDGDKASGVPGKLKLVNMIRDPSYQRIHLAWGLLDAARVPTQQRTFAELSMNGKHYGTYVAMPPMDRAHFDALFPPRKKQAPAAIFKANWKDLGAATLRPIAGDASGLQYMRSADPGGRTYEPVEDTPDADYAYLAKFISALNAVDLRDDAGRRIEGADRFNTKAYRRSMEETMDVYATLRTAAMFNLLGSWDTYYKTPSNYYLHIEKRENAGEAPKPYVHFHPYDMDNTFGTSWPGQKRTWHEKSIFFGKAGGHRPDPEVGDIRMFEVLLRNDDFRAYYVDFMSWMARTHFTPEAVSKSRQKSWDDVLSRSVYLESDTEHGASHTNRPWTNRQVYEAGGLGWESWGFGGAYKTEGIDHFVRMRRENVLAQLREQAVGKSGVDFGGDDWTPRWRD
jgi:hypothetical protein